jgi:uncharacterized membrane protein
MMKAILDDPKKSLWAALALTAVLMAIAAVAADSLGYLSLLLRWAHVFLAIVWVGLVVFVNFVQLVASREANDAERAFLHRAIVPRVAGAFREASTWTVVTGVLLLFTSGHVFASLVYGAAVHTGGVKSVLLWLGVLGGLVMWMFVHMFIWPNLRIVLGQRQGDAAAARDKVKMFARLNLILSLPVTFAMIAAAHLY